MRKFIADLHVHSLLSPCADVEMTPRHLVHNALQLGLHILAITDHNSSENVAAAIVAAQGTNVTIIPGMEVETKEEVHVVALFPTIEELEQWQNIVNSYLPDIVNDEKRFGAQFIVDEQDNLLEVKKQMLLVPMNMELAEVAKQIKKLNGLVFASHIDRPSYSILSQLGFIPDNMELDGVEVSRLTSVSEFSIMNSCISNRYPVLTNSDAHTIQDFLTGPKMVFFINEPSLNEIRLALQKCGKRRIEYEYYF